MSLLIKNGRIITSGEDYVADLFIEGETISAIGKNLNVNAVRTIDATGLMVFREELIRMFTSICLLWEPIRLTTTKPEPGQPCLEVPLW